MYEKRLHGRRVLRFIYAPPFTELDDISPDDTPNPPTVVPSSMNAASIIIGGHSCGRTRNTSSAAIEVVKDSMLSCIRILAMSAAMISSPGGRKVVESFSASARSATSKFLWVVAPSKNI